MARNDSIDWDALEAEEERLYGTKRRNSRRPVQAEANDDAAVDAAPAGAEQPAQAPDHAPTADDDMPDWDAIAAAPQPNPAPVAPPPFAPGAMPDPANANATNANPYPNPEQYAYPNGYPNGTPQMAPGMMPGMPPQTMQQLQQMQQMMAGSMAGYAQQPQPWGQFAEASGDADPQGMRANVQPAQFASLDDGAMFGARQGIDLLRDVEVELTVELGSTRMLIKHILGLRPGSVVELNRLAGEPVDIVINKTLIARGEVVVVDEKFAIRVVEIVPPERRLASA